MATALTSNLVFDSLRYLESAERRRLIKYLLSPWVTSNQTLGVLCEQFVVLIEKGKEGFVKEKIWSKISPGEPYNDVNFRKYCSDLLHLTEMFIAHESVRNNKLEQLLLTIRSISNRPVPSIQERLFRETRAHLEQTPFKNTAYYFSKYRVERDYYTVMDFDVAPDSEPNIAAISESVDLLFLIEKLKLCSTAISQQKTAVKKYEITFAGQILDMVRQYDLERFPELAIHYYAYLILVEEENPQHFEAFSQLLFQLVDRMSQKEAIEMFDSALNYCIGRANRGKIEYMGEYFDIFQRGLDKGIFIVNGELATWRYNNVVAASLRLGKVDWAERFVKTYSAHLNEETRENTFTFNLARVYRYQKKYEQVLTLLRNVDYEDIGYSLISRTMLVITYYELDEYDALDSYLDSFRTWLGRQKRLSRQVQQSYLNLIKFVRKLMRVQAGDKTMIAKIRAEVQEQRAQLVNFEWLNEKIDELG